MDRRVFIQQATVATAALAGLSFAPANSVKKRMGVSVASYAIRWRSSSESTNYPPFKHALNLLEHCHKIGAGGIQVGVGNWTADYAGKVRDRREQLGLYLEGQIRLPKNDSDISRFETEVKQAKEAGADIIRTVCLGGRRYETFKSLEAFQEFKKASIHSLEMAEPVMKKHRVKLAVENHKDWRVPELIAILRDLDSEWIGVTLDTGNSISLMEDPMEVVEGLAPYTLTTHFKDMAFEEYEDGFLLSEVPLGKGALDLKRMISICEKHNSRVTYNLEMITRDPLKIPCLTPGYWATFENTPAPDLAEMLHTVRDYQQEEKPLPSVSEKAPEARLAFEEQNVLDSFDFAKEHLGFS